MKISNDHPYLGFNNLIFCITADVYPTEVLSTLAERQYLNIHDLKKQNLESGEVTVLEHKNKKLIALTIRQHLDTNTLKANMNKCLKTLSKLIDKLKLKDIEIIRDLDMITQLQVLKFIESLNQTFEGKNINATFYNDNLKLPPTEERYNIIKEFHESSIGAHYGCHKTYHKIANEFY